MPPEGGRVHREPTSTEASPRLGVRDALRSIDDERKLKGWSKAKKLAYIAGDWSTIGKLAKGKHRHQRG